MVNRHTVGGEIALGYPTRHSPPSSDVVRLPKCGDTSFEQVDGADGTSAPRGHLYHMYKHRFRFRKVLAFNGVIEHPAQVET